MGDDRDAADHAGVLEQVAERLQEMTERVDQLMAAIQSRDVIGQAKGILMERYGLTSDQAFQVLVSASSNSNVKLHDVALELVATGMLSGLPRL